MNTTPTMDDISPAEVDNPGLQLARLRQQKGYSTEYVASKLHLRVRIIELIESGDFDLLPEPVFIKGYLRAYSKLLGVSADPFVAVFAEQYTVEKKTDRALWQSKRESHKAERFIRLFTLLFAVGVIVAVGLWWQKNKEEQPVYSMNHNASEPSEQQVTTELRLTDLSKMQALLTPKAQMTPMENQGG